MSAASSKLSDAKRAQILSGARTMFLEHGFANTSVEKIAKAAGVSKGTIYNYFPSKEDLLVSLVIGECGGAAHLPEMTQLLSTPITQVLRQFGSQCLCGLLQEDQHRLFRLVSAEVMQFPQLGQLIESTGPALTIQVLAHYLEQLTQAGQLKVVDSRLAAEQFLALCDAGIIRRLQLSVSKPSQAEIDVQVASAVSVFLSAYGQTASGAQ